MCGSQGAAPGKAVLHFLPCCEPRLPVVRDSLLIDGIRIIYFRLRASAVENSLSKRESDRPGKTGCIEQGTERTALHAIRNPDCDARKPCGARYTDPCV